MVRILVSAIHVHSSSVFHAARRQQDTERGFATAYLPPSRHADAYFGLPADLETLFERSVDLVGPSLCRAARSWPSHALPPPYTWP
jgi:hypothetical protein